MVTVVSVTPFASLARVLPVQGQMTSTSSRCLGPMGSALAMLSTTLRPQMRSISRMKSWAAPKRVSVAAPASETMGSTSPYLDCTRSSTSMASLYVQKEPQKANPIFLCSMFTLLIR